MSRLDEVHIGVVGYSLQHFNEEKAAAIIGAAFDELDMLYVGKIKVVVSGLTNMGIPSLAYQEAVSRGWRTVGIACEKANQYKLFPVDKQIIVGKKWGDESPTFLNSIDVLIRVGGGEDSIKEVNAFKQMGKPVYEYELAGEK